MFVTQGKQVLGEGPDSVRLKTIPIISDNIGSVFPHLDVSHKGFLRGTPEGQACLD